MKCSVNSCSSLVALSKVFLACSSVRRLFISLQMRPQVRRAESRARLSCVHTHMMFSTPLGLMKMAMGCSRASWSLLMAFPDTSRMQCLP